MGTRTQRDSFPTARVATSTPRLAASSFVVTSIGAVANAAFAIVLVGRLGADDAGVVVIAITLQILLFRCADLGATSATVRFIAVERSRPASTPVRNPVMIAAAVSGSAAVAIGAAVWAVAEPLATLLSADGSDLPDALRWVGAGLPVFVLYQVAVHSLKGFERFWAFRSIERLGRPLVYLALGLTFAGSGPSTIIAGIVLANGALFVIAAATLVAVGRLDGWSPLRRPEAMATYLAYAVPLGGSRLVDAGTAYADTLLIAAVLSPGLSAIYTASSRVILVYAFVVDAAGEVGGPRFSRAIATDDTGALRLQFAQLTRLQTAVVWPAATFLFLHFADVANWIEPELAAAETAVRWLCLGTIVAAALGPVNPLATMLGRSRLMFAVSATALAVDLTLNLAFLGSFGITAAGFAWACAIVLGAGALFRSTAPRHRFDLRTLTRSLLVPIALVAVSMVVTAVWSPSAASVVVALAAAVAALGALRTAWTVMP